MEGLRSGKRSHEEEKVLRRKHPVQAAPELRRQSVRDRRWVRAMEICRKYFGCHQMASRSFYFRGYQLPLCARCTGTALGHLCGLAVGIFADIPFGILLLMLPLAVDGTVQLLTRYESTNVRRLITGVLFGFSFMTALCHGIRLLFKAFAG